MNITLKKNGGLPSLLSDFFNSASVPSFGLFDLNPELVPARLGINLPMANIVETPKDYKLELAAPGLERNDFTVELENNALTITAEKEEEKLDEEGTYARKEYSFNLFSRTFSLPENIRSSSIEAKYEKGLLKITIPKTKETPVTAVHRINVS